MSVTITLRCDKCGATVTPRVWLKLTKMTVFRLEGGSHGFYVDGARVLCPEHRPDPLPVAQVETWTEYDRRSVEADQVEEAA